MKKLFLFALTLIAISVHAQNYTPTKVRAHRIEITSVLDKNIDASVLDFMAPYKAGVDSLTAPVLGEAAMEMTPDRPESLLSNWVADALRQESTRYGKMADIGLCNVGGLRANMPKGKVTIGDIVEIAPFENKFCMLTLRGSDLLDLFSQIAKSLGEGISGAQLDISADGKLLSATVGGKAIKPNAKYTLATIDYLAEGNDGLVALKKALKKRVMSDNVREVYMKYIRRETAAGRKLTAQLEGRINVRDEK